MNKIEYWLDLARYDLETAKAMLDSKRFLYVGFMCHQTIEKGLKAYYVGFYNDQPPYIHNLTRLAERAGLYERMSEDQKDFYDFLDPLNIEARYPNEKNQLLALLTYEMCEQVLQKTRGELQWIQEQL